MVEPDLVVVEFAVNDEGDETKGMCYESLVRKILSLPNQPAVVLLFAVFAFDWNLQERLGPVGELYKLPMVSIMDAVTPQFCLKKGQGRVITKNQFFYDIYHPSNYGHKIMTESLMYLFRQVAEQEKEADETEALLKQTPVFGKVYENIKLLDKKNALHALRIEEGSFCETDSQLQGVEMDFSPEQIPQFPFNWMRTEPKPETNDYFEMELSCKALMLVYKDSGAMDVGKADVYVDEKKVVTADPHVNGWVHCNPVIILQEETSKVHKIRIQMAQGDENKKFTILGFGYVE